jgi:hypothetical protein
MLNSIYVTNINCQTPFVKPAIKKVKNLLSLNKSELLPLRIDCIVVPW